MVRYVIQPKDGDNDIPLDKPSTNRHVSPEEIGSHILRTLKETAEHHLGSNIKMAVMSVPAEFDIMQRNYTTKAAQLAGRN